MQGQLSPWAQAFRGFNDLDDDRKKQLALQFLQAAGQAMQNPQIVPKPADDEIHLRGVYAGYPARVVLDPFWNVAIDMKAPNRQRTTLTVRFDPSSAPSPGDADPWDEDDEVRVFLARCVFVAGSSADVDESLRVLQALPIEFRQHLYNLMPVDQLAVVNLTGDGPGGHFRTELGEMWDPMTQLAQALWLLAYGANVYAALPPQGPAPSAPAYPGHPGQAHAAAAPRAKCRYCGTLFLLGATSACPNCGAVYTG